MATAVVMVTVVDMATGDATGIHRAIIRETTTITLAVPSMVLVHGDITTAIDLTLLLPAIVITDHTTITLTATLRCQAIRIMDITHFIRGNTAVHGIRTHPVTAHRIRDIPVRISPPQARTVLALAEAATLPCGEVTLRIGDPTMALRGHITAVTTDTVAVSGLIGRLCMAASYFNTAIIPDTVAVTIRSGKT